MIISNKAGSSNWCNSEEVAINILNPTILK